MLQNRSRNITFSLIVISILILLPSFILLLGSSWNGDDYLFSKGFQVHGWEGFFDRVVDWSPRFISEIILFAYYRAVPWLGKPYTGAMILITWLFLLYSIFVFSQNTIHKNSLLLQYRKYNLDNKINQEVKNNELTILLPLLITLLLFIYFIYCYEPSEMYYLVITSVPYVITLAGIILNLNFLINQADSTTISNKTILKFIFIGIVTSCSWEMGAVYQLLFASLIFFLLALNIFNNKFKFLPFIKLNNSDKAKLFVANLIPFFVSLIVFLLLKLGRLTGPDLSSINSLIVHNLSASFIASIDLFFKEIFFININSINFYSFTYSFIYKLTLILLFILLFYQAKIKLNIISLTACFLSSILLIITNFITTFSGYYQLGISSPNRQISFKLGLIGLIIILFSLITTSFLTSLTLKRKKNLLINSSITLLVIFCLNLVLIINLQIKNIATDLFNLNNIISANNQNWQHNLDSTQPGSIYIIVPTSYIYRMYFEPKLYFLNSKNTVESYQQNAYMTYFDKQQLYVTPFDNSNNIDEYEFPEINESELIGHGNVEKINEFLDLKDIVVVDTNKLINIIGWSVNADFTSPQEIIITLENENKPIVTAPVNINRPDVAKYFNKPNLMNSGWNATFSALPEWDGKTLTFKVWTYNPDTKVTQFSTQFTLKFRTQ